MNGIPVEAGRLRRVERGERIVRIERQCMECAAEPERDPSASGSPAQIFARATFAFPPIGRGAIVASGR